MSKLPAPDPSPQENPVAIVAAAIRVLRTRDGIDLSEALIEERARNAVAALSGLCDLASAAPEMETRP